MAINYGINIVIDAIERSLKNFFDQEVNRDAVCGISVRNILQRMAEHGWMGPEFAAMDKVIRYSAQLYIHEFIRQCPIMLKDAIKFIQSDELYLLQTYKKRGFKSLKSSAVELMPHNLCVI